MVVSVAGGPSIPIIIASEAASFITIANNMRCSFYERAAVVVVVVAVAVVVNISISISVSVSILSPF